MKKRFLIAILAFVCALTCLTAGCGFGSSIETGAGNRPSGSVPTNPSNPTNPSDPENPENPDPNKPDNPNEPVVSTNEYTVAVYCDNKLYKPGNDNVTVVWRGKNDVKRVALGADGKASAGELEGEYNVYLEGLPDTYTYNPNIYKATGKDRKQTILLTTVKNPVAGTGEGLYQSQGCYQVKYDGTYRAKIKADGKKVYYEYQPTESGWYRIESWVNIYENEVNPVYERYGGTIAFKWVQETLDGGGASLTGGFTKNFRWDYKVDSTEVGNAFTFAISADSRLGKYPVNVDFEIKYVGEYSNSDVTIIHAEHLPVHAAEKAPGEKFVFADMGTKKFDVNNFKLNPDTGLYHRYDKTKYASDPYGFGEGYGPVLCCAINKDLESYTVCRLYEAHAQGLGGGSNWLKIYMEVETGTAIYDYQYFIRDDYYGVCNSDGVCYVTDELIEVLQKYAEQQMLWSDGVMPQDGSPELKGYYASQKSLWLFACGFYE